MKHAKLFFTVAFTGGIVLLGAGIFQFLIVTSGAFAEGADGASLFAACLCALAVPLLVVPFSIRLARILGIACLVCFVAAMWWAAFVSGETTPSVEFRVAAVFFTLLLLLRIGVAFRKRAARPK